MAASDKFQSHGIMPAHVLSGAAPLKGRSWTPMGFIRSLYAGILGPFDALNVALVGLAFSNTRPGVLNYNTTESFLKVERVDKLLEMLTDVDAPPAFPDNGAKYFGEFIANYPDNFSPDNQYMSGTMLRFFKTALDNGDEDPCMNDALDLESLNMDVLCEVLKETDLRSVVLEADYPIDLCHSKADALVAFENVPDVDLKYELEYASHSQSAVICMTKLFEGMELKKATLRATGCPCEKLGHQCCITGIEDQYEVCVNVADLSLTPITKDTAPGTKCCVHPADPLRIIQQHSAMNCP